MPKSRIRKKNDGGFTPPPPKRTAAQRMPSRWVAPTMVTLFIVGLVWIVLWYLAGDQIPLMQDWGIANLFIGFGFIFAGLMVATRWR
ncbi:MAG: cell division protein CrgA [Actinomycetes bacterium]